MSHDVQRLLFCHLYFPGAHMSQYTTSDKPCPQPSHFTPRISVGAQRVFAIMQGTVGAVLDLSPLSKLCPIDWYGLPDSFLLLRLHVITDMRRASFIGAGPASHPGAVAAGLDGCGRRRRVRLGPKFRPCSQNINGAPPAPGGGGRRGEGEGGHARGGGGGGERSSA